jgi:hypothetical protein
MGRWSRGWMPCSSQVEEVVASSETLAGMAQGLQKALRAFQIGDGNNGKATGESPA